MSRMSRREGGDHSGAGAADHLMAGAGGAGGRREGAYHLMGGQRVVDLDYPALAVIGRHQRGQLDRQPHLILKTTARGDQGRHVWEGSLGLGQPSGRHRAAAPPQGRGSGRPGT